MSTIVLTIKEFEKAKALMAFLKSIDYVNSIEYLDDYATFQNRLDKVNEVATYTYLAELTMEQVNEEVKAYRNEK
jgi:hypothetical protein